MTQKNNHNKMGHKPSYRRIHRTFFNLIDQTYYFPQEGFQVDGNAMRFHDIPLIDLVERHGTPLKLTYLPDITAKILAAQDWFAKAIEEYDYEGAYHYSYCTKSNHFSYVLREAFKTPIHLEMSSAFDVDLAFKLFDEGLIDQNTFILANGFKTPAYLDGILRLHQAGFENVIPILDNMNELDAYEEMDYPFFKIGMRVATEEQPGFDLYTSRFGIRHADVMKFYSERIHNNPRVSLAMLHFFVYTGIRDTTYYWNEFDRCIKLYCDLSQMCPYLTKLNIGGGFPIRSSLGDEYDHAYMISEIVRQLKEICTEAQVGEPDIFTEFGSYTVGESGAAIFKVLDTKWQNDRELWYIIDNSFMTSLPDTWGLQKKFIMLPINKWNEEYERVILGGLTCDNDDYYDDDGQVLLPMHDANDPEPLYIGFFHTGAYQESIGGFGGIHHCLIPQPKHLLISRDEKGNFIETVFAEEQPKEDVLRLLGY
jgi:arginine decarboxylase